ncbi:hypothetical protein [Polaribacter sp.]|uniref:hypothetical protein n=1 Tax=Polaribacter sp. TaxID=1920175 RepID=UPI003EF0E40E
MKKIATLILLVFFVTSCKKESKESKVENKTIEVSKKTITTKVKSDKPTSYLCKINGKEWAYTKASGIIDKNRKTGMRTAIVTFKKKLEKGSESIQLYYNADSFELVAVSLQLKFKKKDGKLATCYYNLKPETKKFSPESKMTGKIDLSNQSKAAGFAEITKIKIFHESLLCPENETISVVDLKFTDIGYSDLDKVFKSLK